MRICLMDTNPLAETPQSAAGYEPMIVGIKSGRMMDVIRGFLKPEFLAPGPMRPVCDLYGARYGGELGA